MAANRVLYLIIIFMNMMFVVLFEHEATYAALYTVLLLPVITLVILLVFKRRINISEKLETHTVKKIEPVKYSININNNIFKFRAKAVFNKNLRQFLKISETAEMQFELCAAYRGVFNISADYILIYDSLGLFKIKIKNAGDLKLTVLPDIISLESLPVSLNNNTDSLSAGADGLFDGEDSDFPDFKKYSPSDSGGYKKIHWQLSAKRGELISKHEHTSEKKTAAVIINNSQFTGKIKQAEKMRCEDMLIESAVSVIAYCVSMDLSVYLDFIVGISEQPSLDFESLYIAAAGIQFDGREDFGELTRENADNVYIFTRDVTDAILAYAKNLIYNGQNAVIFYYAKNDKKEECKIWQITE